MAAAAETVGTTLGGVMAKIDAWMAQRQEIANELRAAADKIMTGESPWRWPLSASARKRPVEPMGKGTKRRPMSAAARKRISEAQKARWAKQKGLTPTRATRKSKRRGDGND